MPAAFQPSLRARLTAYASVAALVIFGTVALLLYRDLTRQLSDAISAELSVRLHDLESVPRDEELTHEHRVALTQLVTTDGQVLEPVGGTSVLTPGELAEAGRHRIVVNRQIPQVDDEARLMARRVRIPGEEDSVIGIAAASTKPLETARDRLTLLLVLGGPAMAAAVGLAAWWVAGAVLHPVRRMARQASTISSARSGERLDQPRGRDEMAELGRTLNEMLERIEDAVAHERAFIDDAAHELRTPLAVLRGELELAAADLDDPARTEEVRSALASALEETDRMARTSSDLLLLARADAGQLRGELGPVDLREVAEAVVDRLPDGPPRVEVEGRGVRAWADSGWLIQVVTNLVANARRHATGVVRVTVDEVDGRARLVVADDGEGFAAALLPHAFDRFARGTDARSRSGGGSGLGLAISASLVDALGGTIDAGNGGPLGGAQVTVVVPSSRDRAGSEG